MESWGHVTFAPDPPVLRLFQPSASAGGSNQIQIQMLIHHRNTGTGCFHWSNMEIQFSHDPEVSAFLCHRCYFSIVTIETWQSVLMSKSLCSTLGLGWTDRSWKHKTSSADEFVDHSRPAVKVQKHWTRLKFDPDIRAKWDKWSTKGVNINPPGSFQGFTHIFSTVTFEIKVEISPTVEAGLAWISLD